MDFYNLKNLSNPAMVGATKAWVEPGPTRDALAAIPEAAGFLDRMAVAHSGLLQLQVVPNAGVKIDVLSDKALLLDGRFDRHARAIDLILAGTAMLVAPESSDAQTFDNLRGRLFPSGMRITQSTYLEEAGEADLAAERIRPEDRALLSTVPTVAGTLDTVVDVWIQTGRALGETVRERSHAADAQTDAESVSRLDALRAKNQWIRVVRAILAGLELAEGVDAQRRDLILEPLRTAVEKAAQKNKAEVPVSDESEPDASSAPL